MSILDSICKTISEFGSSMDKMDRQFKEYNRQSKINRENRARIDKEHLDKIWGKK